MKQRICIILAAFLVISLSAVYAADKAQNKTESQPPRQMPAMKGKGMKGEGMMGQGMMGQGMMGEGMKGKSMMGKSRMCPLMEKKIVATQDGGVVVWIGNKLIKYDKDLNVVNEVELAIDMAAMQQQMIEDCLMKKKSSGKGTGTTDAHTIDPYHHKPGTTQPAK